MARKNGETISLPLDANGMVDTTTIVNPVPMGYPARFIPRTSLRVWSMGIALAARELGLDLEHPEFAPGQIILRVPTMSPAPFRWTRTVVFILTGR